MALRPASKRTRRRSNFPIFEARTKKAPITSSRPRRSEQGGNRRSRTEDPGHVAARRRQQAGPGLAQDHNCNSIKFSAQQERRQTRGFHVEGQSGKIKVRPVPEQARAGRQRTPGLTNCRYFVFSALFQATDAGCAAQVRSTQFKFGGSRRIRSNGPINTHRG